VESADVLAIVVAFSTAAGNGRDGDVRSSRREDGCVRAVLENNTVTAVIVRTVRLELIHIEFSILSSVTNSASHLFLLAWLLADRLTAGLASTSVIVVILHTPVVPPGFVDVTLGSLSASLVITAVCHYNRCGRGDVTRWNRKFRDSLIGSNRDITCHIIFWMWCAILLTR
jgi:hypothetical protein